MNPNPHKATDWLVTNTANTRSGRTAAMTNHALTFTRTQNHFASLTPNAMIRFGLLRMGNSVRVLEIDDMGKMGVALGHVHFPAPRGCRPDLRLTSLNESCLRIAASVSM